MRPSISPSLTQNASWIGPIQPIKAAVMHCLLDGALNSDLAVFANGRTSRHPVVFKICANRVAEQAYIDEQHLQDDQGEGSRQYARRRCPLHE
jgi:hypothetical protein